MGEMIMSENDSSGYERAVQDLNQDQSALGHDMDSQADAYPRSLKVIAAEIRADWSAQGKGVSPYAMPYLEAMETLTRITDSYWADSAASIVRYFLANAGTWRGETARRVKAELNALVKGQY